MEIYWQLDATAACTFNYGLSTAYGTTVNTAEYGGDHQHKVQLAGLGVNLKYYYRVNISGGASVTGSFRTGIDENATAVSFYAYGDTRTQPVEHNKVCEQVVADFTANPANQSFIIVSGDLVNDGNLETDWDAQLFSSSYPKIREMMMSIPYMASMGNHEGNGTLFAKYFPYQFYVGNDERYNYSFDYGPAHFTIVDQYIAYTVGSAQYNWIVSDLSGSTKPWKFILLHEPGWSAGGGHGNNTTVQSVLQPLAETYGVQFFIAGHNHYYARATVNNVQHITAGGGGAPLHDPVSSNPYIVTADKSYNFCKLSINGDYLDFTAKRSDGTTIESFRVTRNLSIELSSPLSGTTYTAPANLILTAAASDNSKVQKIEFFNGTNLIGTDISAPYSIPWNNVPVGTYSITAKATTTSGGSVNSPPVTIAVYNPVLPNTVSRMIATGTDDAEESATGSVVITSTDLEMVNDAGTGAGDQIVGMRFTDLLIPQGAQIISAYIQFTCDEISTAACNLTIKGEAVNNSTTFSTSTRNISVRTKTAASVAWIPAGWTIPEVSGVDQRTPELAPIVQEIVNRTGFNTSSPVTFIVTGTGKRVAEAYDDVTAFPPRLVIEFTLAQPVTPVFTQIGPLCQNSTPPALPSVSTNGISGTWSPSVIATATSGSTVYTFTPAAGQNATTASMTIAVNPAPNAPTAMLTQPTCSEAMGTLTVTSPTSTGMTYSNGGIFQLSPVFSELAPGTYTVKAKNSNGCISSGSVVTINAQPQTPAVTNFPLTQTINSGSSTTLVTFTSNVPGTTFAWTASASAGISGFTAIGTSTIPVQLITNSGSIAGTVTYTITPTANGCTGPVTNYIITVNPASVNNTFSTRISYPSDDVEEYNSGKMVLTDTDLELVYDSKSTGNQKVGLRFQNVTIPKGASISKAYIQFTVDEIKTTSANLLIQGQNVDNAAPFTTAKKNVSGRAKTLASAGWRPDPWTTTGETGFTQQTSELRAIVQEIINRTNWSSGNNMVFIISGTGTRTAQSFETPGGTGGALLHVEFTTSAAGSGSIASEKRAVLPADLRTDGKLTCYPVPFTDILNISFEPADHETLQHVAIFNIAGNLMKKIQTGDNELSVGLEGLSPGVYLIEAQTDCNRYIKTIIKK